MMDFFRKSLWRKSLSVLFFLVFTSAVFFGIIYYLPFFQQKSREFIMVLAVGVLLFFLLAYYVFFTITVARPLRAISREMKALLSGKKYNRIFTEHIDEFGVLGYFFNEVTRNLESISADLAEGKRMSTELNLASDIQKKVIPSEMPKIEGLDIYGNTRSAAEVGGDSFDFISTPENMFCYVGDVTGHGVPSALVMMMVNTLIESFCELYPSGYEVIMHTNRLLKPRIQQTMFMTLVLFRWNFKERRLYYTGAGHEHIMIYRKQTNTCEVKQSGGIALGMLPDNSKIIKEQELPFGAGDCMVLYSDGIAEAQNTHGEMYGIKGLQQSIQAHAGAGNAYDLFTAISGDFTQFVEGQNQSDDMTLIVIKRTA